MKRVWPFLAAGLFSFAILSGAAVWMGGLNQDEGWYLYAAQLVGEGQMPYRDFFFTQGPIMPIVYSALAWTWKAFGLLGGRVATWALGALGIGMAAALAHRLAPQRKAETALAVFIMLGSNLYHLYYLSIPKTYALAGTLVIVGFYVLAVALEGRAAWAAVAGLALAFAAGTRISLGAILAVVGLALLFGRRWRHLGWFSLGGALGLALAYGPFLLDAKAFAGLVAAQKYHAARGGFDVVWTVGSLSRLVRWYLPVIVLVGMHLLGKGGRDCWRGLPGLVFLAFLGVFAVQILAPFPYEDYQVPIMGLLAVYGAVTFFAREGEGRRLLLILGMTWSCSFGSPLLEKWSTNGQDRFWSLKKEKSELAQLRDVAKRIEAIDPGGHDILTQDLYLAIETRRRVPKGLEMGPFAMLTDEEWRDLLEHAPCKVAATSGYGFAIEPPKCGERPVAQQRAYRDILARRYTRVATERWFGQNATTLEIRRLREGEKR